MIDVKANGIKIIGVYKVERSKSAWRTEKRNFSVLSMRVEGSSEFFQKDGSFTVRKGDVLYCPPNSEYGQRTNGEGVIYVHFLEEERETEETDLAVEFRATELQEKFELLYETFRFKPLGYRLKGLSLLCDILYSLKNRRRLDLPARIRATIDESFSDSKFSVCSLARKVGFSETYVRRVFSARYGMSPSKYLFSVRLFHAKSLIESGYYKIYDVAFLSGYDDEKYFSVSFRRYFGYTPSSATERQAKKDDPV